MARQREQYGILYEGDFGLSALAEMLSVTTGSPDEAHALRLASEVAAATEGEGAVELGVDVRCLLDSPLPDDIIRTAWLAAAHGRFDPAACESGVRGWLRRLADRWPQPERRHAPGHWYARPNINEEDLRTAVVAEIRASAVQVGRCVADSGHLALPSGAVVESLEAVARQGDGDLGLRLFLRVLKGHDVPVGKEQYDRLMALDAALGFPGPLVYDGLNVLWPPIDTARRDASGDFGLSALTSWFEGDWQESTAHERVRRAVAADDSAQTPGSAAALLLADVRRLLDSSLRTETIKVLWLSATGRGYNIDHRGIDARDWLRLIGGTCEERLTRIAPQYRHAEPPDRNDLSNDLRSAVLRAVREAAPLLKGAVISPHWEPIPGVSALAAVEEVVTDVDADLGFRLLLRLLDVVSPSLTQEQYSHCRALGTRFGYGEDHVTEKLEHLVRQD
ncbi:hypothetical protein [Streptomyces sp. NBC_01176]|uniref:hypothetical protein n=1 Tax=Streptomyces sp. NBC_01176 TaxID=2903760 RepID=UPI00386725D7|nr:hypothetical protein OG199_42465 [Streptomyces sp. NBC_01176]